MASEFNLQDIISQQFPNVKGEVLDSLLQITDIVQVPKGTKLIEEDKRHAYFT